MAPDEGIGSPAQPAMAGTSERSSDLSQIIMAEAAGSGMLAFIIVAAGILGERFAIHNIALALLMTALAGAAVFAVLARALSPLAPSFFNPALALALTLAGRMAPMAGLLSAAAQIAGACLGVMAAHLVTNSGLIQVASQIQTGEGVWAGEFLATVLLVFTILSLKTKAPERIPLTAAFCLLATALATPSTSFANPALTLARTLTDSFTAILLTDGVIICGVQIVGAICAFGLQRYFFPPVKTS